MKQSKLKTGKDLLKEFSEVRNLTMKLIKPLQIEDYVIQTDSFMSPPRWHIGHVSWFYDQLLKKFDKNYKPYKEDFSLYFNSYYLSFGSLWNKGRRGTVSRPTVNETLGYWKWINKQTERFFNIEKGVLNSELIRHFELAFNHENQHQELLVYDLQHLLRNKYFPDEMRKPDKSISISQKLDSEMIKIPGGLYEMGFENNKWNGIFCYDIEMPLHKVWLNDFFIDKYPVTNRDYLDFINDGGYGNFRLWLSDGWNVKNNENWNAPMYWEKDENDEWVKYDFKGKRFIKNILNEPVINVSYFEADAFAKWKGKRLPSEAEWEKAASWDEDKNLKRLYPWGDELPDVSAANMLESFIWAPAPAGSYEKGKSFYGCHQMIGDCWEWTASEFMPYPGFKSGFEEYNDKWFSNQKVLRGGSFGTPAKSTRNTYRNFFRTNERWLIGGFRCASDSLF